MNNTLKDIEGLYWIWKGRRLQLGDLQDNQLRWILKFLKRFPKAYHNKSVESWTIDIKYLLDNRISNYVYGQHKQKKVDKAVNHYFRRHFPTIKLV